MNKTVIKVLITLLVILLIAAGAMGAAYSIKDNRSNLNDISAREERANALRRELEPLKAERQELENEQTKLKLSYSEDANGVSAFSLIFDDMSEEIYTSVFPIMKQFGYVADVAITDVSAIGAAGKLSMAHLSSLSGEGWSLSVAWDGEGDGAAHYAGIKSELEKMGLSLFPAVLYTGERFTSAQAAALRGAGVTDIFVPETSKLADELVDAENSGIIRSAAWNREGGNLVILSGISLHEDVIFTAEAGGLNTPLFRSMLEMLKMYESGIAVKNLGEREEYHAAAERERAEREREAQTRLAEIEARIKEIKQEINSIYVKYGSQIQ